MKHFAFIAVAGVLTLGLGARTAHAATKPDWAVWGELLHTFVDAHGRVDYGAFRDADRAKLDGLVRQIASSSPATEPARYPADEAKAYYINAYNVLVWKSVLGHAKGFTNVDADKDAFFYKTKFTVGGAPMSLSELEQKVIRPRFADPRLHMALNCASGGCPELPREPFIADKLDIQLVREARRFCNEPRNVSYSDGTAKLSHIFDWYKDDFGGSSDKVIGWINRFRQGKDPIPTTAKVEYIDYDWTLNDVHLLRR